MYDKTKDINQAPCGSINSPSEPTRFSLQTQLYTLITPVQPSYDTEAAQPHLPALCAPDNSLGLLSPILCSCGRLHDTHPS